MTLLAYSIPGDPIPKARPRVYGSRTITPASTVRYESLVRMHTTAALARARRAGIRWDTAARIEVQLVTHRATRRQADLDNLAKSWADGAQSILYANDAQIDHLTIARGSVDAKRPRLVVLVRALSVAESEAIALAVEQCMGEETT